MKKLFFLILSLALFCSNDAFAATRAGVSEIAACTKVTTLPDGSFVYKNSAPLRNSSGAMIGLRYEPTLIMKKRISARSTRIYDSKGKSIGSCPWTTAHGFAGGRMRCSMKTAALRGSAMKTGSPAVYFTLGGGQCAKVPDAGKCYGSVKGGCNRTIK